MVQLLYQTQNLQVNTLLVDLIAQYEAAYPDQVRSYYLHGSYVNGTATEGSDVDLTVVFKGAGEQPALVVTSTLLELDIGVTDENKLLALPDPLIKLAGVLIYGEDIRDQLPMPSIQVWTRDRMHTSYWRIVNLFQRAPRIAVPLDYPEPNDEFYGYLQRKTQDTLNTRDLIRHTGWMATALVALQAKQFVLHKSDCHRLYREYIGDEWSTFLETIYQSCKFDWRYQIPQGYADRRKLRDLCAQVLAFENHFLLRYKEFLLQELRGNDQLAINHMLWLLGKIPFEDLQITEAIRDLNVER